jgi:hypothetical protein
MKSRENFWLGIAAAAITVGAVACFLIGHSTGADVAGARADGASSGSRIGAASGAEAGFSTGYADGREKAYKVAFAKSKREVLRKEAKAARAAAAVPVTRECGSDQSQGVGVGAIASVGASCEVAVEVAQQWQSECGQDADGSCAVSAGFACTLDNVASELSKIVCTNGSKQVTFETGV